MALTITNGPQVAAAFEAEAITLGPKLDAAVDGLRHQLAEEWRARVTKRTGGTAASIGVDGQDVGSDAPDIHRLEVGFHGADSLGRIYDQAPQPALGPAFDLIDAQFDSVIDAVVLSALDG